jgi:molybdenum cofactor cytidylyltransferase
MRNVAVLVLAAGKSSRMNGIKQLEKINNKTLLDITLEKLKCILPDKIYCVLGANADKIKAEITSKNVQFIENSNYEKGLSSSIISGIQYFKKEALKFDGIYILLADQPAIEIAYLESLLVLFKEHKEIIIASNYGNKLGVPAIFPKKYFPELLLIKGDKGAKEFINQRKNEVVCPESSTNFFDIDTKEDLELFKNS